MAVGKIGVGNLSQPVASVASVTVGSLATVKLVKEVFDMSLMTQVDHASIKAKALRL